jgi:L-ascorbate metabolism protein UlaG (beta-lactamase superfamily)
MHIKKIAHSCVLIEDKGKKLLFDPGTYAFDDGIHKPEQLSDVDLVLITHEHADHLSPEAIKTIIKNGAKIVTNASAAAKLKEQGITATVIGSGKRIQVEGFTIEAIDCPHGELPFPAPTNTGFVINDKIFNPGDCLPKNAPKTDVLLVPIAGPFLKLTDAIAFVKATKPHIVIPVHEAVLKYPTAMILFKKALTEAGFTVVDEAEV